MTQRSQDEVAALIREQVERDQRRWEHEQQQRALLTTPVTRAELLGVLRALAPENAAAAVRARELRQRWGIDSGAGP